MLRIRFENLSVAGRLDKAKTNKEKEVAWRMFAAALTEELNIPITDKQLRPKYTKLKAEHRRHCADVNSTGNQEAPGRPPSYLPILSQWFASRGGISSQIIVDTDDVSVDDNLAVGDETVPPTPTPTADTPSRQAGITRLATEVGRGMTAMADAIRASRPTDDSNVRELLREQHSQNQAMTTQLMAMQATQNELLERLLGALTKNNDS
jgi:hypothetical protein